MKVFPYRGRYANLGNRKNTHRHLQLPLCCRSLRVAVPGDVHALFFPALLVHRVYVCVRVQQHAHAACASQARVDSYLLAAVVVYSFLYKLSFERLPQRVFEKCVFTRPPTLRKRRTYAVDFANDA